VCPHAQGETRGNRAKRRDIWVLETIPHFQEKYFPTQTLSASPNPRIAELAGIVLEVALVKPYKKRRLKALARERRHLLAKLDETGLIMAHHF